MTLFIRFFRPRSWRSLSVWMPLIVVGFISCVGLSLAMGFRSGILAQHDAATLRDGGDRLAPKIRMPGGPPLRSSRTIATGYGPLVFTVFWGDAGHRLGLPGIPNVGPSGTVLASPAVLDQSKDDWTGEIGALLGDRQTRSLPREALAHPREMVIVEFIDMVPLEIASKSNFQPIRAGESWAPETGFVVMGLLILVLPSVALARAASAVHLNTRARRNGLLRVLGTPPRQLAVIIATDMTIPMLLGALVGSAVYAGVMSSLRSFTLAGNSYWASDLLLPVELALALPLVVVLVGLMSIARTVLRTGRDPVGTMRRTRRRRVSPFSYVATAATLAGPAAVFMSADVDFALSVWLIVAGLFLSVVGHEALSRIVIASTGRVIANGTRAQVAGSRLSRSGAEALLGVSATSVAVLLIVFAAYANIDNLPSPTGDFDVFARFPDLTSPEPAVREVAGYDGVTRVVPIGRVSVSINEHEGRVYTMTCDDARGSIEIEGPCKIGNIYPVRRLLDADTVAVRPRRLFSDMGEATPQPATDTPITGTYPVGGRAIASWLPATSNIQAVLITDEKPVPQETILLITTDGAPESLRRVMEGLRNRPEESSILTHAALTSPVTEATLVLFPYLFMMATASAGTASVAVLFAVLLLFRQRQAEFRMLRALGATRVLLAFDLVLLFAVPLTLSFGLAVASGAALATSYNTAFGVPASEINLQAVFVLAVVLATGFAATVLVAGRAVRIPPLVTDPDAAAG